MPASQTVNLSGISSGATDQVQTLTVTASSSNPGLIPNPAVTHNSPNTTGSITFTPVTNSYGTATITVTVNNGGTSNNIISQTFTVTVNPVNQPPTLNPLANRPSTKTPALQTVNLSGITSGAGNRPDTDGHRLHQQPGLDPDPDGQLHQPQHDRLAHLHPSRLRLGSATITVTVNNGGTSNNIVSQTFTVTVNPVNQPPTLNSLANMTINENASLQTVNLSGITSGAATKSRHWRLPPLPATQA